MSWNHLSSLAIDILFSTNNVVVPLDALYKMIELLNEISENT